MCGPPGMMNIVSGDKAPDRSQGEVKFDLPQVSEEDRVIRIFCNSVYASPNYYINELTMIVVD